MKKFLKEYKHLRSKSETETSNIDGKRDSHKVDSEERPMGVLKWLRRERVTVTTRRAASPGPSRDQSPDRDNIGTIRTEEYKRDLAEFQARRSATKSELHMDLDLSPTRKRDLDELQARRSIGKKNSDPSSVKRDLEEFQARRSRKNDDRSPSRKQDLAEFKARRSAKKDDISPTRKKCGRHSLPVSCTTCTADADTTFNYEKKSAGKYKKKSSQRRPRSATSDRDPADGVPKIQFLFQNQVFMPGDLCAHSTHKRRSCNRQRSAEDYFAQKQLNFKEDDDPVSPPLFYKNNSLPFDENAFLYEREEVDGAVGEIFESAGKESSLQSSRSSGQTSKGSCEAKLSEVLCELKSLDQWADEQLRVHSNTSGKSEDSKSDASTYGLPVVAVSDIDVTVDRDKVWNSGTWGAVPVQMRKLPDVTMEHVRRRESVEVDILRKCRHPNVILLMGLYPDARGDVHIICERFVDSLYGVLHVQGHILSIQTAVQYISDVANALLFLRMRGYIHTELTSHCIMITGRDQAKLADFQPCVQLVKDAVVLGSGRRSYEVYDEQPQYVNIGAIRAASSPDGEPLLSTNTSEAYLTSNSVSRPYSRYRQSPHYRWHAPELFEVDARGLVHPCSRSDVYALSLVLWESCNASLPWRTLTYDKLKDQYSLWNTGVRLPSDGTYPGCLLAALKTGLNLRRASRPDLTVFAATLRRVQQQVDELEYIVIPARLKKKQSNFTDDPWERSPNDSDLSPRQIDTHADIHTEDKDTSTGSDREQSPLYESIKKEKPLFSNKHSSSESLKGRGTYEHLAEKEFSSACSTPISRIKAKISDIGTPGVLHRTDSTEYCSILSPRNCGFSDDGIKDQSSEKPSAKLSRSFTPKSYKPLHIKVPACNLDCIKSLPKEQNGVAQSSYHFDIKNYSLPNTPIARSNKLRKNAWLSGELSVSERGGVKSQFADKVLDVEELKTVQSAPETPIVSAASPEAGVQSNPQSSKASSKGFGLEEDRLTIDEGVDDDRCSFNGLRKTFEVEEDGMTINSRRNSYTVLKKTQEPPDCSESEFRDRTHSWSFRTTTDKTPLNKNKDDDSLAGVNVKPLVAIHERWIYEANKKTGRSMSLPDDNRSQTSSAAVKPASHCVDTLQKSLPQLAAKRPLPKFLRGHYSMSPSANGRNGSGNQSEQFCQARDNIAKCLNLTQETDRFNNNSWRRDAETCFSNSTTTSDDHKAEPKASVATDTCGIEEFIRDLIRKELHHLLSEISDESFETQSRNEDLLNRGVANVLDALKDEAGKKETKHSKFKINGNNNPVVQITFAKSGDNCFQVVDNCVNVTISESHVSLKEKQNKSFEKLNRTIDDTLTEDFHSHSLKRCQTFRTLQEARSTEDLYIDDDLSTQMQENFGGKVKLIPLHGSLHEILCEKEDDCCLIKFKQENGCDTIYFKCDNSDTESRDAIDGACNPGQDTVLYKRISLVEERVQRIFPKDKRATTPILVRKKRRVDTIRPRPKSEVIVQQLTQDSRVLSNSSPSLPTCDRNDEVEVNIENVMSYQDSSSDECLKCQADYDDFELLEKVIDNEISNSSSCKCLEKISEENLSTINEEMSEKEQSSDAECKV